VSPRSPKSSRKSSNHATDALDLRICLASEILVVCSFKSPGNFRNSRRLNEAKNTHQNAARVSCTLQSGERLYRDTHNRFCRHILSPAWDFGTCDACNFSPAYWPCVLSPMGGMVKQAADNPIRERRPDRFDKNECIYREHHQNLCCWHSYPHRRDGRVCWSWGFSTLNEVLWDNWKRRIEEMNKVIPVTPEPGTVAREVEETKP
jgi:hypothetical protein